MGNLQEELRCYEIIVQGTSKKRYITDCEIVPMHAHACVHKSKVVLLNTFVADKIIKEECIDTMQ